jgi:hypothetical protein
VLRELARADFAAVDVAPSVDGDTFGGLHIWGSVNGDASVVALAMTRST